MADRYDVVIIGAGLIGSSIAWKLVSEGCSDVALVDVDEAGLFSSSELSAGGVRALWSRKVDVEFARASIDFYETLREEVGFKQRGYIWLHAQPTWDAVQSAKPFYAAQQLGVEYLSTAEVQERLPEADNLEGIVGATFSPKDGLINANLLKQYYRARAIAGGATLLDRHMVMGIDVQGPEDIVLKVANYELGEDCDDELEQILSTHRPPEGSSEIELRCGTVVNAAGAWSSVVAALYGDTPPVRAVRRQISLAYSRAVSLSRYGMIVLPGGLYCHPEAGHTLCGWRDPEEKEGFQFKYGGQTFFLKDILPRLVSHISGFEKTRHMGGWAGLVAETPDGSGVLGRVPGQSSIYEAYGFTGKGATQSYAVGVCMADLLLHNRFLRLDGGALTRDRFAEGAAPPVFDPLLL